jgi:bis(5'-nucleosidyl)-tetraphosphatase
MAKEISAGAVIYRKNKKNKKTEYLLLHKTASEHYKELWDFPKGNVEVKESSLKAAQRETEEETGLTKIRFDDKFKEKVQFFYRKEGETIFKEVTYYLAELMEEQDVKISEEHSGYKWLGYKDAMKTLTHKNSKEMIVAAEKFIIKSKSQKKLGDF